MAETLSMPPAEKGRSKKLFFLLLPFIGLAFALFLYTGSFGYVQSEFATVEGDSYLIASPADGRIKSILVEEGQELGRGTPLVALDDGPLLQAVLEARAALQVAAQGGVPYEGSNPGISQTLEELSGQAEALRNNENLARQHLEHWTAEHSRAMLVLRSASGVSGEERDKAITDEAEAKNQVAVYREQADSAARQRADLETQLRRLRQAQAAPAPGRGQIELWQARLAKAEQALADAIIYAPDSGRVLTVEASQGQQVRRGQSLLSFIPSSEQPGSLWVSAVFEKQKALQLRLGLAARVDVENGPAIDGTIAAIQPDERGYIVRVNLEAGAAAKGIFPGQAAQVSVKP